MEVVTPTGTYADDKPPICDADATCISPDATYISPAIHSYIHPALPAMEHAWYAELLDRTTRALPTTTPHPEYAAKKLLWTRPAASQPQTGNRDTTPRQQHRLHNPQLQPYTRDRPPCTQHGHTTKSRPAKIAITEKCHPGQGKTSPYDLQH